MSTLNRRPAVALLLLVLVCGFVRCHKPGGPFVTVTIVGLPKETTKLTVTATFGDMSHTTDITPVTTQLPLTLDLPYGSRGPLVVAAQASVRDTPCTLATGTVTVDLGDDIAYEAILLMVEAPLDGCSNLPTLTTVTLTVKRVEAGGSGSVVSTPSGISCASNCIEQNSIFRLNTQVTLTARPAVGSQVRWSAGGCNGSRVCNVNLTAATTITATFTACSSGWCDEGSPDVTSDLYGIWGSSSSTVYAVGANGSILRRSNNQWVPMTSGVMASLRSIGAEKGSATPYVGGDNGTLLTLNGATWNKVDLPAVSGKTVSGVTGEKNPFLTPPLNLYLCTADGGFYFKGGTDPWTAITDAALNGKTLYGLAAANIASFAGGGRESTIVGSDGLVLRRTDSSSAKQVADNTPGSMTTAALRSVWTGSSLSVAVGDNGVIIRRGTQDYSNATRTWMRVSSPITSRLNSVCGGDDNNIWIVGDGGVILKYDGMTVTPQTNVPPIDLVGVWAADADPTHVYAVGRNGTILHYVP